VGTTHVVSGPSPEFDVVIVGAGLAGASAAVVLGRQGRRVALVDPRPMYPPAFKAEKIEPDQADLFRRLGLMDGILPCVAPINSVVVAHRGRVLRVVAVEQYGMAYQDMVNAVRRQLPASVELHVARASGIENGPEVQSVSLDNGRDRRPAGWPSGCPATCRTRASVVVQRVRRRAGRRGAISLRIVDLLRRHAG
jgi:2-polyprenyl-6-methoxyphenol hydroxylase-like FAD-dependent oxidoreductase